MQNAGTIITDATILNSDNQILYGSCAAVSHNALPNVHFPEFTSQYSHPKFNVPVFIFNPKAWPYCAHCYLGFDVQVGAEVILGDRNQRVTLQRMTALEARLRRGRLTQPSEPQLVPRSPSRGSVMQLPW